MMGEGQKRRTPALPPGLCFLQRGRRGLNPRPTRWQRVALPLSYALKMSPADPLSAVRGVKVPRGGREGQCGGLGGSEGAAEEVVVTAAVSPAASRAASTESEVGLSTGTMRGVSEPGT